MYCVVVGDIVDSRAVDTDIRKRITTALQSAFDRINTDYIGSLMTTFGMVRGDAFEGVMLTQYHAPQIVQDIIKAAYSVEKTKVRISVVLGQLTVTSDDRNIADGPAFHTAFEKLEKLKTRESTHWLQVSFDIGSLAQSLVNSHLALMTALTKGWTNKQHEIVWAMEKHGGRQKAVGKMLGIPPSVVSKQLKAANYDAYRQAWEGLTDYLINMDEYTTEDKPIIEKSYVPHFNRGLYELERQRNFEAAQYHFQIALNTAKNEMDKDDPLLIPLYNKLARASIFTEKYEDASRFINECMRLQEKMPKARMQYAETLLIHAELNHVIKDYLAAKELYQKALDIARELLGDDHDFTGSMYNSYASLHYHMSDYDEALKYFKMALRNTKEERSIDYATMLSNIARCHYATKNYKQATLYAEEALILHEENLPPNHKYIKSLRQLLSDLKNHEGGA